MPLKLFLMTKNEIEMLEDWLKYHGFLFGLENIHVLDGSDDPRVIDVYDKYMPLGLHVHYSSTGLNGLAEELTLLMHAHKGSGNFLIKLDTDEFLAYTLPVDIGPKGRFSRALHDRYHWTHGTKGGLSKRLSEAAFDTMHGRKTLHIADFKHFFEALPITGQKYKASLTTWSVPRDQYVARPCRELVEFTRIQFTHMKSYFYSESFVSVDLGSHGGVSVNNEGVIDTGLTLIHYHSTSVEDSARRARQVLLSHEYIDAADDVETQRQKLSKVRENGRVNSFHKIDFYLKYLCSLQGGGSVNPESLNAQNFEYRQTGSNITMTLVRDTLNLIERTNHFGL